MSSLCSCVYLGVHVCVCVCVLVCACLCLYVFVYLFICVCLFVFVCRRLRWVCVCICVFVYVCMCVSVCPNICKHMLPDSWNSEKFTKIDQAWTVEWLESPFLFLILDFNFQSQTVGILFYVLIYCKWWHLEHILLLLFTSNRK